ncbi:leucyl/phenylalanyl-tRNA--protein transferase [Synechocystis sp. LKSZ1]|uniref:leucyl/phenylalanyl-tRNA--protein transferase n=1 Tax=Synechocystis sp. LKSZ1 TaxID=3144951 RepID=UPI00336BDF8A
MELSARVESIIQGYAQGYFLMADDQGQLGWYASQSHALIPLDHRFRYPKSLRRVLNQSRFSLAINRDFVGVCRGCAGRESTWISPALLEIYQLLHQFGWAHSFEAWAGDRLAGGILGISIGGVFIGESMFYTVPEASKAAMVMLVQRLRQRGFVLFDAQLQNPHLERFGAYVIDEAHYQRLLAQSLLLPRTFV